MTLYEKGRADAEANGMRHIDYGLSVLGSEFIRAEIPPDAVADLADACHRASLGGRLRGFEVTERFYEIGSPEGLAELEAFLAGSGAAGHDG